MLKPCLAVWVFAVLLVGASASVQVPAQSQERPETQRRDPARSVGREEITDYYKKWLGQDVVYIITPEEYGVFIHLTTDDERDNFIEQFWLRRDPDPTTRENEFKIEHYRRLVYANEKFTAGVVGWKTDRGRIYIMFGPPDRLETMPAGGSYHRKRKEGGGFTSVYPFEVWEYRHIEGVGEDIELEFVDDRGGGLYELTFDNQRKDELLHSGFMGPTLDEIEDYELTGSKLKQYRVVGRRFAGDLPDPYRSTGGFETEKDRPFSKLVLSSRLNNPPEIRFKDLEAVVNSAIYYNRIAFSVDTALLRVSSAQNLATVTLQIPHSSLTFKQSGDLYSARAEILGQLSTLTRNVERVFEDVVAQDIPLQRFASESQGSSVFQKQLFLAPGLYKLNLAVKDAESGNLGTWEGRLEVPRFEEEKLQLSSIILAQEIGAAEANLGDPFQLGRLRVVPRVSRVFRQDESMGFYLRIYESSIDQATGKPDIKVEFAVTAKGETAEHWRDCSRLAFFAGEHSTVARLTSLQPFAPGDYTLRVRVIDRISGQTAQSSVPFSIQTPG